MMPPSRSEWLPEGHRARFISDVVTEMDRSAIYQSYDEKDGRGQAAYHPLMRVKLLLYGYCVGVVSSRKIEAATYDPVAFRYLAANEHPDHDSIAEFRRRHLPAVMALFWEVLPLCRNDRAQLAPLRQPVEPNRGAKPAIGSADTDSHSPKQVQAPVLEGIDLYGRPDDPPKINERKQSRRTGPKQHKPPRSG